MYSVFIKLYSINGYLININVEIVKINIIYYNRQENMSTYVWVQNIQKCVIISMCYGTTIFDHNNSQYFNYNCY